VSQNYPAVGTGQSSGQPLYGRKYLLQVYNPNANGGAIVNISDSSFEPEALRIAFNVYTPLWHRYWFADIDIYNISPEVVPTIINAASNITPGMTVILSAGYVNGNYDVIWQGPVFQPLFVRLNVTDYKLTLHCILSLLQATDGQVMSAVYGGGSYNQSQIVTAMIKSLGLTIGPINGVSTKVLPRDKVVFGSAADHLDNIAKDNPGVVWFLDQHGLAGSAAKVWFSSLSNGISSTPGYIYSPTTGLLGTPIQTQDGVEFTVLLDPRIKAQLPPQTVGIDQAIIQQYSLQPGQFAWPIESTGNFIVGAVRHRGDSRGDAWETDITGYVPKVDVINQLVASST
jgi:hypothetical protein